MPQAEVDALREQLAALRHELDDLRRQLSTGLEETGVRDPLTGCFDRRYLERMRGELELKDAHWVCLRFDLTDLEAVVDSQRRDQADRVLRAFAHFLSRNHRSEDILVRLGADRFALLVRARIEEEGRAIAQRIVEAAARDSPAAFSLGTAVRRAGESLSDLLSRADHVLHASKGRNLTPMRRRPIAGHDGKPGPGFGGTRG
jgi:diguanylate cyclase (GGDEF)-like protein